MADSTHADRYERLLDRTEQRTINNPSLARDAMTALVVARNGLTEAELLTYLGWPGPPLSPRIWRHILYAFESGWASHPELLVLSPPLREAVVRRYLATEEALTQAHQRFADYCAGCDLNERKVAEYPWQLAKAKNWSQLYRALADLNFFAAAWKASAVDVRAYWGQIERHSPLRMVEAYTAVVAVPVDYLAQAESVGELLHETGYCIEAAQLRQGLVEYCRQGTDRKQLANVLVDLGMSLRRTGDKDRAMQLLQEAEPLLRELNDEWKLSYCLGYQAIIHTERGNLDFALDLLRQQEQMARRLRNNVSLVQSLGNQSIIFDRQGKHSEELRLLQEAEAICRAINKLDDLATMLTNQAAIHLREGKLDLALKVFEENERLCESAGDPRGLVLVYRGQAQVLADLGRFDEATARQEMHEMLCRRLRAWPELAQCLNTRALFYRKRGDNATALRFLQQAEELFHQLRDHSNLSSALAKHAEIAREMGNPAVALNALAAQEPWLRHAQQPIDLGRNLRDRAEIMIDQERFEEALPLLSEAEALFREAGNRLEQAVTLLFECAFFRNRGDVRGCVQCYDTAEELCQQSGADGLPLLRLLYQDRSAFHQEAKETALALETLGKEAEVARQLGEAAVLQLCLEQRANLLYRNGREDEALPFYVEQEQVCRQSNNLEALQRCLGNQGLVHKNRKDFDTALKLYEQQVAICRQEKLVGDLASSLGSLASVHWKLEQWQPALETYREQESIYRTLQKKDSVASALLNQGSIHRIRSELDEALACFQKEEELLRELGNRAGVQANLGDQASLHRRRKEPHRALEIYQQQEALARELGDRDGLQACLCDQGNVYYDFCIDLDRGLACYQEAERICIEANLFNGLQIVLGNQGLIYNLRKQTAPAIAVYRRKEAVLRELKNNVALIPCLESLAVLLHNDGDIDSALPIYQEIEQLSRAADNRVSLQRCLGNQVLAQKARKDWNTAATVQKQKIELLKQEQDKEALLLAVVELDNLETSQAQPVPEAPVASATAGAIRSDTTGRTLAVSVAAPIATGTAPEKYDVFISYAHQDNHGPHQGWLKLLVQAICDLHARFTPRPLEVFLDLEDIRPGDYWEHRILRGLRMARLMVAVISPAYFNSDYCRREWEIYCEHEADRAMRGQGIHPIYIVKTPDFDGASQDALDRWRSDLKRRQYLDLQDLWQEGIQALQREDVRQRLERLDQLLTERLNQAESFLSSPTKVPQHNRNFVGREEELRKLREVLAYSRVGAITAVHGLAGMGKSALAFEYAHANGSEYPGGRFLISAAGARDLPQLLIALADQKGIPLTDQERQNPALAVARVRSAFENGPCALVILDNVDDASLVTPQHRTQYLPSSHSVHFLVTTRLSPDHLPGLECLPLNPLPEEDGRRLLEKHRPFKDDDERKAAERIVRRLGGYTLALEVVAVFLWKNPDIGYRDYLVRLEEEGLGAVEGAGSDPLVQLSRHPEKLIGPLLTPTLLTLTPEERRVVEYAALLTPDRIPLPWLRELAGLAFPDLLRKPRPGYPDLWERLKRRLFGLRLLLTGDNANLVRMHRVVQEVIKSHMSPEERDQRAQTTQEYVAQRTRVLDWVERGNRWEIQPVLDYTAYLVTQNSPVAPAFVSQILEPVRYMAEIERGRKDYQQALALLRKEADLLRQLGKDEELQAVLAQQAAVYRQLNDSQEANDKLAILAEEEQLCRKLFKEDALQACLGHQAAIYRQLDKTQEALACLQEQAQRCRTLRNHDALQVCLGHQAALYKGLRRIDDALACLKEQEIHCRTLSNWQALEFCLCDQANLLYDNRLDLARALALYEEQERICVQADLRAGLQVAIGNQGLVRRALGEQDAALELFQRQEALCTMNDHQDGLEFALGNQANVHKTKGNVEAALQLYRRQQTILIALNKTARLIACLELQAVLLHNRGDMDAALPLYLEIERLCLETNNRVSLRVCLGNQALLHKTRKNWDAAQASLHRQDKLCREMNDGQALATCLAEQGHVQFNQGNLPLALELYQAQEELCRQIDFQAGLQTALSNQALVHIHSKLHDEALELYAQAADLARRVDDRRALQGCLEMMARVHYERGEQDEALQLVIEQEKICRSIGFKPGLGFSLRAQALVWHRRNEPARALPYYQGAEAIYRELGNLPELQYCLENLARLYHAHNNTDAALACLSEQEKLCRQLGHKPGLAFALNSQGFIRHQRNLLDEALPFYQEAEGLFRELNNRNELQLCLDNQARILNARKETEAALEKYRAQEKILRELEETVRLQACLGNQAMILHNRGDLEQAEKLYGEQERLCRLYREQEGLQSALHNQGRIHHYSRGDSARALPLVEEAVTLLRELPGLDRLTAALINLGNIYSSLERPEALDIHDEALGLYRRLIHEGRADLASDLAVTLNNKSSVLDSSGRLSEALACVEEAIPIYRQQHEQGRPGQAFLLGVGLSNRAYYLHELGRFSEALEAGEQAIVLLRPLPSNGNDEITNCLSSALTNVGDALVSLGRPVESLPSYEEAITLRRDLAEKQGKSMYNKDRAWSLTNQGLALALVGKPADALAVHDEAIALYQRDLPTQPHLCAMLARALVHKGEALEQLYQPAAADACYLQGLDLLLPQAEQGKAAVLAGLADSLRDRYRLLKHSGRAEETADVFSCVQKWIEPVIKDGTAPERVVRAYYRFQEVLHPSE